MRLAFVLVLVLIGLVLALAPPADAAAQCAPRDVVREQLHSRYNETVRGVGIAENSTVLEIYASEAGTWTITVTMPTGTTCLVASGNSYETVTETLPPKGVPG